MKQVHKNACVTNAHFSQYQKQLCLPGEVEKGLESVTMARLKRKGKKDTINAILTLKQSLRQTSGPAEQEAAAWEAYGRPGFSGDP